MRFTWTKAALLAAALAFAVTPAEAARGGGRGGGGGGRGGYGGGRGGYGGGYRGGYGGYRGGYGYGGYGRGYGGWGWGWGGYGLGYGLGYGYGYPGYYGNYYGSDYYPYYDSGFAYAPTATDYQSFYPPDYTAMSTAAPSSTTALVRVRTAPGAQLWFDDTATTQTGAVRVFTTPELQPGKQYEYHVKVRWMDNGKAVEKTKTVDVTPGQVVNVDLTPTAVQ